MINEYDGTEYEKRPTRINPGRSLSFLFPLLNPEIFRNQTLHTVRHMPAGGIGSRKGKGPTKWEGPPGTICHGVIMDRLFLRRRHWLPKRRGPRSGKALPAPSAAEQSWTGYFSGVGIGSRKEGPDGDKWSKTTQETSGGSGGSEANGVLRNPYHPPGVTIYIEKNIYGKETD